MTDSRLHAGLLREAVMACDRGASVEVAAARYGLLPAEVAEARRVTSPTRIAMAEYRAYTQAAPEPTSVAGY